MAKTIQKSVEVSFEIKRSEFIAFLDRVRSDDEVQERLSAIKMMHPDASHHCYAYILGENQGVQRYDDDGEPSQTAGIPILEVLKKHDLTDVLCVVVRYYGGIKLGAGGLIRAYTKGASETISKARFLMKTTMIKTTLTMSYSMAHTLEEMIREQGFVKEVVYQENVVFHVDFALDEWSKIKHRLIDVSRDTITIDEQSQYTTYL